MTLIEIGDGVTSAKSVDTSVNFPSAASVRKACVDGSISKIMAPQSMFVDV